MNPIVFAINAIIWVFTATLNLGPWLTETLFLNIIAPMVGRDGMLKMGAGTTIPISVLFLGAFWGGIWLIFWGALGAADLAWWGVIFGVISGWRAGAHIADGLEQVRAEIRLDEADNPSPERIKEHGITSHAGTVNISGFDIATAEDEAANGTGSNGANGSGTNGSALPGEIKKNPLTARRRK